MRTRLLTLLVLPLFGACATPTDANDIVDSEARGELGKADVVGSCATPSGKTFCGRKGTGNCWCDDACTDYGDCCSDAGELCGIEPPPPQGDACGGFLGLQCDDDEFCFYPPEHMCGAADHLGECATTPEACILLFDPVCGCDGETYSNSCFAAMAGTSVLHAGECAEPEPECPPVFCTLFCEHGFVKGDDGCDVCECAEPEPEPGACKVAGCSAELCVAPEGPDFSICIFEPWYECLAHTQCGTFGPEGSCGWEPTPAYVACLESHGM
jgi:eight-cysteine-cluster-containing protein